jgi:hypothetical protein
MTDTGVNRSISDLLSRVEALEREVTSLRRAVRAESGRLDLEADVPEPARKSVAQLKALILDPGAVIEVRRLIDAETRTAVEVLKGEDLGFGVPYSDDELRRRVEVYTRSVSVLTALFAQGCYWGSDRHIPIWAHDLERVANASADGNGLVVWINLRLMPALILMYSGGLGAVASGNYSSLRALLEDAMVASATNERAAVHQLVPAAVMDGDVANHLEDSARRLTPLSDWLWQTLRSPLENIVPEERRYDEVFDRLEYMIGLAWVDANRSDRLWGPIGRFAWRRSNHPKANMPSIVAQEVEAQGADWPPLKAGMFGGDRQRLDDAVDKYNQWLAKLGTRWM